MPYTQGSAEWLEVKRSLVTATDVPVLLGLSPWKCEADLADEKLYGTITEPSLRMRVGSAVEGLIGEEYERVTGRHVQRVRGLRIHPTIEWAGASPDFRVIGERRLVEAKRSSSRTRFADGLPQDVEGQVQWQLGVTGYPVADVAALVGDDDLAVFEVEADPRLFGDLVAIAEDFRARLAAGGPFSRDLARVKRDHPADDGSEMVADTELNEAMLRLIALRAQRKDIEAAEEAIEAAVRDRMGPATLLIGEGYRLTLKRTKDVETTDWRNIADGLLRQLGEPERTALVSLNTSARAGFRPFRLTVEKESS
jgi:putative phage-type endonuclease